MKSMLLYKFLLFFIFLSNVIEGQPTFTYSRSTTDDERIFDAAEDESGNYYFAGRVYSDDPYYKAAYLLSLDPNGQLIYENIFLVPDSVSYFGNIYCQNDSIIIFGAKGSIADALIDQLWMLVLDNSFNIICNRSFTISGSYIGDLESTINQQGHYVICGNLTIPPQIMPDIFLFEISPIGDSIRSTILAYTGIELEFDLLENREGGYKVFAKGNFPGAPNTNGKIVYLDTSFNYIWADSIPYGLKFGHTAKWLSRNTFLITGYKNIYSPSFHEDLGIVKVDQQNNILNQNHFGKLADTIDYVGACSNLDLGKNNDIYFGGASNIIPEQGLFQNEPSWILLNNLDTNLNLNWQQFYGGDAAYYLWGLEATNDGGCLLMATRYDAELQDQELDIYILKVDSNGLLTSNGQDFNIPVQELSISPNPAHDRVNISYPDIFGNDKKELILYNALGVAVLKENASYDHSTETINISSLPGGLYFVVLKVEGRKVATGKVVKI
mgnify:CR=1 FL=1